MIFTWDFSTSEHLAVVPPMSSAITSGSPIRRPSSAAPHTPDAGPDSTMVIGMRDTEATESTPQLDCMR